MKSTSIAESAERDALIALSLAEGIGVVTLQRLQRERTSYVDAVGQLLSAKDADDMHTRRLHVQQQASAIGCDLLTFQDQEYPQSLLDLPQPPMLLFTRGNRAMLDQAVVAIVGTRICSSSAARVARELGAALASAGACVVSGLAKGVDAAAHRGALSVSGNTCAVLGTGIDVVYPVGHASLQRTIEERGCIVTEFLPGTMPSPGGFPRRNRIIAALAQVTIVVEAGRTSGARITADRALDIGRTVAAVPGPVDSVQCVGSNELLREGAHVIATIDDALSLVGVYPARTAAPERELSGAELALLRAISDKHRTTQQLVELTSLPVSQCLAAISSLEVDGRIESTLTGEFRQCPKGSLRLMGSSGNSREPIDDHIAMRGV